MNSIEQDLRPEAALALADGTIYRGRSLGAAGSITAEVVFNTAMTGYQEILTDPSYTGQIVTLTYPHIGNVGVNHEDEESASIAAAGLIIRCASPVVSNFRSEETLEEYLKKGNKCALYDIDTRALVRHLRETGSQAGTLFASAKGKLTDAQIAEALKAAKSWGSMQGKDLASLVTTKEAYTWSEGTWGLNAVAGNPGFTQLKNPKFKVVAYDFGIKRNILRMMAERGIAIAVVPAKTTAEEVLKLNPDGVFLSNGPGDPEPCDYAIEAAKVFIAKKIPLFGICLGHQIMALASGAKTIKMKFGHHGANHPVVDRRTGRVSITSQNHGFAVDEKTLPANVKGVYASLFDRSLQGLEFLDTPAMSFQGHPEASPGPRDIETLFDCFVELMEKN